MKPTAGVCLVRVILCLSALLLVSCGAERFVRIYKTIPTIINGETDSWDGNDSYSAWGGFNQEVLDEWLKKAQIESWKIEITITYDDRKCVHGFSSMNLQGTYEYQGAKGSFQFQREVRHNTGSSTPSPKVNISRCNATASEAIALGVARSIRNAPPPTSTPAPTPAPAGQQLDAGASQ